MYSKFLLQALLTRPPKTWSTKVLHEISTAVLDGVILARFLSLVRSKLKLCSANHGLCNFSSMDCDWLSIVWAYSEQDTARYRKRALVYDDCLRNVEVNLSFYSVSILSAGVLAPFDKHIDGHIHVPYRYETKAHSTFMGCDLTCVDSKLSDNCDGIIG